ncbi:PAS domain S-box protein [Labilibacter marinus]|uniref:PAS domain S-box protein n=1 Tax=Labilibacter marinus TaxID=1477105 RepID=UPI00083390F0|nr:PAS domain S-box protein [Labilibacter marinus]
MIQFEELLVALNELENIVVVSDIKGNIRYVNDAFVDKYGYSREEAIGSNPSILRTDYHNDGFYKEMWRTILNGDTWEGTFLNKTKSGRLVWEEAKISPVHKNGELDGFIAVKEDITYKKELEEQFHKEKFLLDELFDNAPVGVILFKPIYAEDRLDDIIVIKANPIAGGVFNRLGLVGLTLKQFLPDFPNLRDKIVEMLHEKQIFEHYFSSIDKHLNMRTFPLENDRFCMYVHDVTKYRNNITALQKSEQRYSSLVEDSPALIRRFNIQGKISYVNSYYADYFDKTPNEFIDANVFDLIKKEEQLSYKEKLNKLSPNNPIVEYEQKIQLPNGQERWQKWVDRALIDAGGNIVEYQSVGMDFTQLKRAEEKLEEQRNRLNAIFDNSIMGIGVVDKLGNIQMANSRLLEMLNYSTNKELTDSNYFNHILEDDKEDVQNSFVEIFNKNSKSINLQRRLVNNNGDIFWVDIFVSPISEKDGKVHEAVGLIIDITRKHQMEEELVASEKKLKKLNNTKDKLFSVIAHDIKNPFNAILGFSSLLNKNLDKFSEQEVREFTKRILEASEQTYKLLEDLLTWAKSQLGQLSVRKVDFSPNIMINDCMESLQSIAQSKNISLQNKVFDIESINCDIEMFKFVIRNLLHNGIKFSQPNSSVECGAMEDKENGLITFYVKDYGVGINPEKLKILFNLEEFLSTVGTSQEKGTGLGLSLSKEMVELNGGSIEVFSEVNAGSEFRITFPHK